MRRHSTDLLGLLFGSAFLIAGAGFLVRETTDTVVNPVWVTGLGLMLLGAIALVATVARTARHRDDELHTHDFGPGYGYGAEVRTFVPAYATTAATTEATAETPAEAETVEPPAAPETPTPED